jgi:hypothetical protein
MDDEDDFAACFIDVHENFLDQRAHELLLDPGIRGGSLPRRAEIDCQSPQALRVHGSVLRDGRLVEARLAGAEVGERGIPTSLELGRDQAVVGIDRLVPAPCELHGISGLLAFELQRTTSVSGLFHSEIPRG